MRRWSCPSCGSGVLAPDKPRADDVRRFCLPCSKKAGKLVKRSAPALEKARAARSAQVAAKSTRTRERTRQAEIDSRSVDGLDMLAEAKRIWRLPSLRQEGEGLALPVIEFRRTRSGKKRTSGHCWYDDRRIVVTLGTDKAGAAATVLHELVHAVARYEGHSRRFWSLVRSGAREAWPEATFDFRDADSGWRCDSRIADCIRPTL